MIVNTKIWSSCRKSIEKYVDIGKMELQTRIVAESVELQPYYMQTCVDIDSVEKEHYNIVPGHG